LLPSRVASKTAYDQLPVIGEDDSLDLMVDGTPADAYMNGTAFDSKSIDDAEEDRRRGVLTAGGDEDKVYVDERDLQTLCNEWNRLSTGQSGDTSLRLGGYLGDVFEGGSGDDASGSGGSVSSSGQEGYSSPLSPVHSSANEPQWKTSRGSDVLLPYRQILFVSVFCGTLQASFLSYVWRCSIWGLNLATALFFIREVSDLLGRILASYVNVGRRKRDGSFTMSGLVALVALVCMLLASFGYVLVNVLDRRNTCSNSKPHHNIAIGLMALQVSICVINPPQLLESVKMFNYIGTSV
jgi:hypothetical protein